MKTLNIGTDLSLPLEAATQTFAFIGRKGSGKTYTAGKLVECLLDANVQVIILDSVGNWFGLRLSADGKSAGYDIPVIGGMRGDIPLEATGGYLIADILTETGRSLIVDISQFSKADRQRFATAFAERLWRNKKAERHPSPIHLVIEESQLIVPENVRGDSAPMVGIYEEIIRLGRNYGIGVSMISQRPQSVNKEVLNQTECLFAFQVNGKHERIALRDWIVYHGAEKSLVDTLPSLPVGTAYVWSPQWLRILEKVGIGQKKTFDGSATPKVGGSQVRRELKSLDLDDLKARMARTMEKAKADDPIQLRKRITELDRQLKAKPTPAGSIDQSAIDQAVNRAIVETEKRCGEIFTKAEHQYRGIISNLQGKLRKVVETIGDVDDLQWEIDCRIGDPKAAVSATRPTATARQEVGQQIRPLRPIAAKPTASNHNGRLPKGETAILTAIAQYPEGASREQITILTGYKRSSRDTYLQRLRQSGLIEQNGELLVATPLGIDALGSDFEPLPTGEALRQYWIERLPAGESQILQILLNEHPKSVDRESISEATGYKRSSRDTYLQRLTARKLVAPMGRGEVRAADVLFEG